MNVLVDIVVLFYIEKKDKHEQIFSQCSACIVIVMLYNVTISMDTKCAPLKADFFLILL